MIALGDLQPNSCTMTIWRNSSMAWRRSPYGLRGEFDEMLTDMRRQFSEMVAGLREAPGAAMLQGAGMRVDVSEHDDEVVVVADCPGVDRQDISLRLIDPRMLRISVRREEATETEREGYYMRERTFGAFSRSVSLPVDVTEQGAEATFKNGVLELRLPKTPESLGREIPLTGEAGALPGGSAAEEHRRMVEREYEEGQKKIEPSGYISSEELEEQARDVKLEKRGSPEEQSTAAELRRQKEEEREEAKRKLE
jgi:HSP20 family protein